MMLCEGAGGVRRGDELGVEGETHIDGVDEVQLVHRLVGLVELTAAAACDLRVTRLRRAAHRGGGRCDLLQRIQHCGENGGELGFSLART